jgi:hypothetical protein
MYILRILLELPTCGSALSDYSSAINGVKQEAVLSPVLFCVHVGDLLLLISKPGVGC